MPSSVLAADMGMRSVIIDDGWQTIDNQRGYAFTGDWEVAGSRFSDLPAHVDRTHSLGMAELLWISLPFVGRESAAARQLTHLLLPDDGRMARLWDVRLPEARSHLAAICRRLVADYHLDGLKIDFIDQWSSYPSTPTPAAADTSSYTVGVDRLLAAIVTQLQAVVDNPMIEFRQSYIGPRMMRYGNMFRVADCPADGFQNRVSSLDLRHLIKERAVHADMVMWSATDPAEDAAEQLLCTAFSVPQISMLLSQLPNDHTAMLRHYLAWWAANRDVLLWGQLWAPRPDLGYPLVTAVKDHRLGDHQLCLRERDQRPSRPRRDRQRHRKRQRGGESDVCSHGRDGHRLLRSSSSGCPRRSTGRPASFLATPGRQLPNPELVRKPNRDHRTRQFQRAPVQTLLSAVRRA